MEKLTEDENCECGRNLFAYMRELLEQDGDKVEIKLHHAHMQSLLMFAPDALTKSK
jgi:hypothetical protein